jgi:hypothetical protein
MTVVTDLQSLAICGETDVLSLLRKAYLVARKLGLAQFQVWTNNELNGYTKIEDVPNYRKIHGTLKAWNPMYGWVPAVIPDDNIEKVVCNVEICNSIPSLIALENVKSISLPISAGKASLLSKLYDFETNYSLEFASNNIHNIIEQVKNRILDWAILLEEKGIQGDELSFSLEEKNKAQSEPQIVNYISNFYGSVSDTQFQQGTTNSEQLQK